MKKSIIAGFLVILFFHTLCFGQSNGQGAALQPLPGLMEDVRSLEKSSNLERLASIKRMLENRHIPYKIEMFALNAKEQGTYPRTEGSNVVVTVGSGSEDIVIGGHWDAVWLSREKLSKGVIDNGCSSVILVRLAETLKSMTVRHRIRIVFFDMEEIGFLGSRAYIRSHKNDPIAAAINLDVCGFGDTIMLGPRNSAGNNRIYRALKMACVERDINFVEFPEYPSSDDRSFNAAGIENISIGILPADLTHQMWIELNGDRSTLKGSFYPRVKIHSEEDNSENVDPKAMTLVYSAVLETVKKLDKPARN